MLDSALLKMAQGGDKKSHERIVNENMGLVWSVAKKFSYRGYETEDLAQVGVIGLIKAVDRFDLSFGVQFSTYAVAMIAGEIKRFIRDDGAIKVSRSLKEAAMKGYSARERLYRKNGCEPQISEIAAESGVQSEVLVQAFNASAPPESIYASVYDGDDKAVCIADRLAAPDSEDEIIDRIMIQNILAKLDARERQIIVFRYFKGKTQSEIAKIIGVSQVQVSRIEKAVLKRLRENLAHG